MLTIFRALRCPLGAISLRTHLREDLVPLAHAQLSVFVVVFSDRFAKTDRFGPSGSDSLHALLVLFSPESVLVHRPRELVFLGLVPRAVVESPVLGEDVLVERVPHAHRNGKVRNLHRLRELKLPRAWRMKHGEFTSSTARSAFASLGDLALFTDAFPP